MAINESKHEDHAFAIGGFSPFTLGHQAVAREMQKGKHASVSVYTTKATTRPIPVDKKVEYIKKSVAPSIHVGATVTPLHALSDMHSRGLRGSVTFYGGSDRKPIVDRLKQYNGKEGGHGYYKFDAIHFKQVGGERKEGASGLAGISGTAARASKSPEELKKFIPKELHKHATEIFNHIQDKTSQKKPIRERYINEELFNLLDTVETKEGHIGEIVYRGSNYVTIQLPNNQTVKSWIYEIKESKQNKIVIENTLPAEKENTYVVRYRHKINEKIPALLLPSKKLIEEMGQVKYDDYTTKNLEIDKTAGRLLKSISTRNDLNPKYVKQAIMAVDKMFDIEKQAAKGKIPPEKVHDFTMYASIAHDTLNLLGYQDKEIMFVQKHYIDFSKNVDEDDADLQDDAPGHLVGIHGGGEIDEWTAPEENRFIQKGRASPGMFKKISTADYETRTSPDGKTYKVKKQIISKGHQKIDDKDKSNVQPFVGMYEEKMKFNYDKPIKNLTHDTTKPDNRVGLVPFSDFLKMKLDQKNKVFGTEIGGSSIQQPPPTSNQTNSKSLDLISKTKQAKTAAKRIQMGLD